MPRRTEPDMRIRLATLLLAVFCFGIAGCAPAALHPCDAPDCTEEGIYLHLDEDGQQRYYCEVHYRALVPEDQQAPAPAASRDASLCELCENEGVLVFTDENGAEHLFCTEHYQAAVQLQAEQDAGDTAAPVCEICGKQAILSTRTEDGETHYYCFDHYSEMLDILQQRCGTALHAFHDHRQGAPAPGRHNVEES